jgi:hypothetical protein
LEHHPWNCETLLAKEEKSEVAPSCKRSVTHPLLFEQEYCYENAETARIATLERNLKTAFG